MTGFWIVAGILLAIAMVFLLPPLLRKNAPAEGVARSEMNLTIYRDQLAELETDLKNGTISQEQYDQARQDLERGLLEDTAVAEAAHGQAKPVLGRASAVAVVVVVPVLTIALYSNIGGGSQALDPEAATPQVVTDEHMSTIEGMVGQLEQRLREEPNNIDGWFMLGRSYQFLKRYGDAKAAFERVMALGGGSNPDFLATYADVLAMSNDRRIGSDSAELIQRALQLNPFHVKSLWLAGTAAYQDGQLEAALKYWERLAEVLPEGSEDRQAINANIAEVRNRIGLEPAAPAPTRAAARSGAEVKGSVRIADALAGRVSPGDTVFIFARAANGPRMPLAILRKQAGDLPLEFTLDDSLAMSPMMNLSSADSVVVGARVSKSGNAMPQPGDLEGLSQPLPVGQGEPVQIVIDRVVE